MPKASASNTNGNECSRSKALIPRQQQSCSLLLLISNGRLAARSECKKRVANKERAREEARGGMDRWKERSYGVERSVRVRFALLHTAERG